LVDGSYTGEPFATGIYEILGATVKVASINKLYKFVILLRLRVVERSFGWFEKSRSLWKNYERKINTILQMFVLAFLVLLLKRS
jgi:transposase